MALTGQRSKQAIINRVQVCVVIPLGVDFKERLSVLTVDVRNRRSLERSIAEHFSRYIIEGIDFRETVLVGGNRDKQRRAPGEGEERAHDIREILEM